MIRQKAIFDGHDSNEPGLGPVGCLRRRRRPGAGEPGTKVEQDRCDPPLLWLHANPGDEAKITNMLAASTEDDRLGIPVRRDGDRLKCAYPVAILAAARA
jgi:hypothetical protein